MVSYWYPTYGHPDGPSRKAWFRVVDGWGYCTSDSPAGVSDTPVFRVVDGFAYPTTSLPGDLPNFELVGSFAYAARGAAWFRIEERPR